MQSNMISAVFDSRNDAENAMSQLRAAGVSDSAVSIVARHDGDSASERSAIGGSDIDNAGSGLGKGLTIGAGVGALFGLAALAIPGVGPFIAAGALANALGAAGGAVAAGAIVGGTAGGLSGALMNVGVSHEDASYYENRVNDGGVVVAVDTSNAGIDSMRAQEILRAAGGRSAAYSGVASAM